MINPSDYKRTGIFIEEKYTGQINTIAPSAPNVHFVPGFSKKSTVFNRPVLLNSTNDRKMYFGDIDRSAEKKGSFFHRTIDIALQTAPVYALNLLKTDVNDVLDFASISLSSKYNNTDVNQEQYDSFFNKTGFWQRDTESFLFFVNNPNRDIERKLHIANVGNKNITFFTFKISDPAFDITAEQFYANKNEEIPTWINPKSLMNDFMVRTIVVVGDFTNYAQLSVDSTFYKYFNTSGLRKNQVDNFLRDRSVTVLGDYRGSVIPYFTDMSGRNLFIETLINNETDRTGLFAAMDIDNIETDYPTGVIDLIGETLAGNGQSKIDFMSYKDTIIETDEYDSVSNSDDHFAKTIISDIQLTVHEVPVLGANIKIPVANLANQYILIDDVEVPITIVQNSALNPTGWNIISGNYVYAVTPAIGGDRKDVIYITKEGVLGVAKGNFTVNNNYPDDAYPIVIINRTSAPATTTTYTDTFGTTITDGGTYNGYTINLSTTSSDPISYVSSTNTNGGSDVKVSFKTVQTPIKDDCGSYFINNLYKTLSNKISGPYANITDGTKHLSYTVLEGFDAPNNKYITFSTENDTLTTLTDIIYTDYQSEPISAPPYVQTPTSIFGFSSTGGVGYARIGRQSELYMDFINGRINSGDYFATSFGEIQYRIEQGINGETLLVMDSVNAGLLNATVSDPSFNKEILIPSLTVETVLLESVDVVGTEYIFTIDKKIALSNNRNDEFLDADNKIYLKMYTVSGNVVKIDFYAENEMITRLSTPYIHESSKIYIYSGEKAYTQTLEIEDHNSYTNSDTKFLIDMARYRVKINDYVDAYFDELELRPGEEPKRFARIIKKTAWSGNTEYNVAYAEITVDVKYDSVVITGGKRQTMRYTTIENYIDTYKGIKLNGFIVKQTSMPDGTETRQKEIMSIVGKNTPLYNAIVNKQKFNFRYLIDSFGLGLTEFSKQDFMDLVGKRKNSIAFLNAPSAKQFKNSTNPYFINDDGTLNMEFVKKGGDEEKNPSFLYSFGQGSGKDDGRDCASYFFPYVTINDNSRPLSFPPAAFVANSYMRKNSSTISGKYNFTVAAGVNDGLILGIANTEMDFVETDYEFADAMGLNLLSYNSNYGFYIETEYTASITPKTALSNLHTRELLIDMENEMYAMLFKYQYQFNIPSIRAKIKREADDICQKYYERGGVTYYLNVIDESNNTAELIDNQFGLLETTIIPVSAMAKIVNIFNITNNGALGGSSGFSA